MSVTSRRMISKVSRPRCCVCAPSAIVCGVTMYTISPRASDCCASLPASGSTPWMRQRGDSARRERRAADQPAAAEADEQVVQVAHLLQQFARRRAPAGDDVGMVVRRHERHAALLRQAAADRLAILGVAVVDDDLGAVAARRRDLYRGRVVRHHDRGRNAQQPAGERDRLRVVADENATTPARRWAASKRASALYAPRNLNAPARCRFSHLKNTSRRAARRPCASAALACDGVGSRCAAPRRRRPRTWGRFCMARV